MAPKETRSRFFDPDRGGNFQVLPEELVRRQLVEWLVDVVGAPRRLVAVEYPLSKLDPRCRKRADVVVWQPSDNEKGLAPWLLAECKGPAVRLGDKVADQVRQYAEKIRAHHLLITNGTEVRAYRQSGNRYVEIDGIPPFAHAAGKFIPDKKRGAKPPFNQLSRAHHHF